MRSIKPGRGPSAMGAAGSVFAIVFGIFWTALAYSMTRNSPFPVVGTIFPLFGVCFVGLGIMQLVFNLKNATSKERFSLLDITEPGQEIDPLERRFGSPHPAPSSVAVRLKNLEELRAQGLISASEYEAKRKEIIGAI